MKYMNSLRNLGFSTSIPNISVHIMNRPAYDSTKTFLSYEMYLPKIFVLFAVKSINVHFVA
ncbi:unnamed protein product [Amoebophrya sp. A25]|nr:unnamed protein product [Amoebophrya sp. A25]|eukprot:GSA25T00004901001.1